MNQEIEGDNPTFLPEGEGEDGGHQSPEVGHG
jgi:hypothetical protein